MIRVLRKPITCILIIDTLNIHKTNQGNTALTPPKKKKPNTQTKQKIKMMDIHTGIYVEEQIGIMIKTNIDTEVFLEWVILNRCFVYYYNPIKQD